MSTDSDGGCKYSTNIQSRTYRWRHQRGHPHFSAHALSRFDERADNGSVSPERAWLDGFDVAHLTGWFNTPESADADSPDTVRYHPGTDAVLVVLNETVVTVLRGATLSSAAVKAYLNALDGDRGRRKRGWDG